MRAQTEKTTFSCKDDWGKSLHVCPARAYTTFAVLVFIRKCKFGLSHEDNIKVTFN